MKTNWDFEELIRAGKIKRPRKISGHRLDITWSGEYGAESTSTGDCVCGWSESGSSQRVVRAEYRGHLISVHALSLDARQLQG